MANNNKAMIDLPFFELCNQAPAASQAIAAMTTSECGDDPFLYYLSGSNFYRHDMVADTWQQLASPVVAPSALATLRYTAKRGFHGRVLSATGNTVQIPGLRDWSLDKQTIEIIQGTGTGQQRELTYVGETTHEAGVITATGATFIQDSTKKFRINQYAGYMLGITFGTDATQYKKILYNNENTLFIADANLQPHDPWNNQPFVASFPYALPVVTAGLQAHYQILSHQFTVPAWTTQPDYTSFFTTMTGGIYLVSSLAAAPFFSLQYYDVLHDSWQQKTTPQGIILAALGTDVTIERTGKFPHNTPLLANVGLVTGGARTLSDDGRTNLEVDRWRNHRLVITGGTGVGQTRRLVSNTADQYTTNRAWDIIPDSTSTYEIWPDYARLYMAGGAASAMYAYSTFNDCWEQGQYFDDGVVNNISCTMKDWTSFGVTSGTRIAAGVRTIASAPVIAGTGYAIGDTFSFITGSGSGAKGRVTALSANGVPSAIELIDSGTGTGYTVSTSAAVTNIVGTGSGMTVSVTAVGPTANIVLASAAVMKAGDSVTFAGCTEGAWNAAHTILGVSVLSSAAMTFSVSTTATANMSATASQSTTTIVDASKNWIVNEHVGRIVDLCVAGLGPTSQKRWIISNTAKTLTVATIAAGVNGTSKYTIYDAKVFGCDMQRKETGMEPYGHASAGSSATQLVDSTKNWIPGQWIGYFMKIEAGIGYGTGRIAITGNTNNTLQFASIGVTPDATTRYEIADTWGLASASTTTTIAEATSKNWVANQWAGKRAKIIAGTGVGQETAVASNTNNTLTTGTITAGDATSVYAIFSIPPRGAGIELIWTWGATDIAKRKQMLLPRGSGSNSFDIYDIATEKWTFGRFFGPQSEPFNVGSSYAYDGKDTVFMGRCAAGLPIRTFKYNVDTNKVRGGATTTWLQNTAHVGNFMEIAKAPSGEQYLYCLQNTGTLMSRALLF